MDQNLTEKKGERDSLFDEVSSLFLKLLEALSLIVLPSKHMSVS